MEYRDNPCRHCSHWRKELNIDLSSCGLPCWKKRFFLRKSPAWFGIPKWSGVTGWKHFPSAALLVVLAASLTSAGLYATGSNGASAPPSLEDAYPPIPTYLEKIHGYAMPFSAGPDQKIEIAFAAGYDTIRGKLTGVTVADVFTGRTAFSKTGLDLEIPTAPCRSYRGEGCQYPGRVRLRPKDGWTPGTYQAVLETSNGLKSRPVYFNIHPSIDHGNKPRIALVYPTFTWQAYNAIGGMSFYTSGPPVVRRISLHRPQTGKDYHHPQAAFLFGRLLNDLNREFFSISDLDLHQKPGLLDGVDLVLVLVHDEYWSLEMREHMEDYLRGGGNLLVAGGNTCWGKIRVEYPEIVLNQLRGDEWAEPVEDDRTGLWLMEKIDEPAEKVFGLTWATGGYPLKRQFKTYADVPPKVREWGVTESFYEHSDAMVTLDPKHPVFSGTGLKNGNIFGSGLPLVFTEVDGLPLLPDGSIDEKYVSKTPPGIKFLAATMIWSWWYDRPFVAASISEHRFEGRGTVLNLGSMGWYKVLQTGYPTGVTILKNSIDYMLDDE